MEKKDMITVEDVELFDTPHWKITTPFATYLFDRTGGGFSQILDMNGNDWIQFENKGAPNEYRGIPNIQAYHGVGDYKGIFHPGYGNVKTVLTAEEPFKISILCTAEMNGEWVSRWDIFPDHARCTVLKGTKDGFAFLYEGVPGGLEFSSKTNYMVEPDGNKTYFVSTEHKPIWMRPITPEWVYFGDDRVQRVLYYIHHENDNIPEAVYQVFDALTVFGFGRDAVPGMNTYPQHFTIGFCETDIHKQVVSTVEKLCQEFQASL